MIIIIIAWTSVVLSAMSATMMLGSKSATTRISAAVQATLLLTLSGRVLGWW